MKNIGKIALVIAFVSFIGCSGNDAFAWGWSFPDGGFPGGPGRGGLGYPGGAVHWGPGHGYVAFPGGDAEWGHRGGGVAFPGGEVWWGHRGHGGVGINLPGFSGYFGW